MPRSMLIALGLLVAAPVAAEDSPLSALEFDVIEEGERPDDALQRMVHRPRSDEMPDPDGGRVLRMDWRLDSLDEHQATSAPLQPPETTDVLSPAEERGHGHGYAFGYGHEKSGDREPDEKRGKDDDDKDDGKSGSDRKARR